MVEHRGEVRPRVVSLEGATPSSKLTAKPLHLGHIFPGDSGVPPFSRLSRGGCAAQNLKQILKLHADYPDQSDQVLPIKPFLFT